QRVDRVGGGEDRVVHRLLRVRAARQGRQQRVTGRPGGRQGRLVGAGRRGDAVADDGHGRRGAVGQRGGAHGEGVLVAVVAQAAVADRGDRAAFLFHVVPFARLGVAAVLAVAVLVHPARAAGHADRGPRAVARLGGHPRVRCLERVLVGLRGPVHPAAGRGTVGLRRLTRGMRLTRGVRGRLAGDGGGRLAGDLPGRLPGGLTGHLPGRLFAPVEAH